MRIAWFAPHPNDVARELGRTHDVDHVDAPRAHDFVWQHFQRPYDVVTFELGDTRQHEFVWPYLFHYPGVVLLRAASLQHSRSYMLAHHQRHHHLRSERAFSGWHFLRAPLLASRLVVVQDAGLGRELQDEFPDIRIAVIPAGVRPAAVRPVNPGSARPVRLHVAGARQDVVARAVQRARDAGAALDLSDVNEVGDGEVTEGDVVVALEWPPAGGPPIDALRAMAAGLTVIMLEAEAVAALATLDPQTWQRRGYGDANPVAISIDPRDEEHSLMLALRRLAADAALRATLGQAARTWASHSASVVTAAAHWAEVLQQAAQLAPMVPRTALPAHLLDDGTARVRGTLGEFGLSLPEFG